MSKAEVGKIDMREVEEVGIGVLVCEEGIAEMEGVFTWENGIQKDTIDNQQANINRRMTIIC